MENRIKQLDKMIYEQIAAGEVVTAPISVVKELCENSIDANATNITIELKNGGKSLIRITDDGVGIAKEDVNLAFAAHATSKISSAEDLNSIATLGFRGEALFSIAAIAKVRMITKRAEQETGTLAVVEGGEIAKIEPIGAENGTTISVSELFYNVPARQKFLKAGGTSRVVDFVSKLAVCYTDIKIKLVSDGAVLFSTLGNGRLLDTITSVYGSSVASTLIKVDAVNGNHITKSMDGTAGLSLSGYISNATGSRRSRRSQVLFVNGRSVRNPVITAAIDNAYKEFAEGGKFPVVYLFLRLPSSDIDVNIHPSKLEIAFSDNETVREFVERTLFKALSSEKGIPRLVKNRFVLPDEPTSNSVNSLIEDSLTSNINEFSNDETAVKSRAKGDLSNIFKNRSDTQVAEVKISDLFRDDLDENSGFMPAVDHNSFRSCTAVVNTDNSDRPSSVYENKLWSSNTDNSNTFVRENTDIHYGNTLDIAGLQVIATLFATYILASSGQNFYIIDQHAAHERINYEKLLKAYNERTIVRQQLIDLYTFTVPATALPDIEVYKDFLCKLGFEIEEFGDNTYTARTFPSFFAYDEAVIFLSEILSYKASELSSLQNASDIDRLIMRACKSSIKANRKLSDTEITSLLKELSTADNPYTCPHGRPVFLKLTKAEIERMFKRS